MHEWTLDRWLGVLGFMGTTLGIVTSLWIWVRSRREAVPRYKTHSLELIAPRNEKNYFSSTDLPLRVQHGSESSDRVSKLFIAVWNSGRRTLNSADSVGDHQFLIRLPSRTMVWGEPRLVTCSRSEIGIRTGLIAGSNHEVFVDFNFLDKDDGGLIEILCAGETAGMEVSGTFKGAFDLRGGGNLGIQVVPSFRERLLVVLPQFLSGGKDAYILWFFSALWMLAWLFIFPAGNGYQRLTVFATLTVLTVGISLSGPVVSEPLPGSTRGVPRQLCRLPYVPEAPRSRKENQVVRFAEDLRLEVSRRWRQELHPWERGDPGPSSRERISKHWRRIVRRRSR